MNVLAAAMDLERALGNNRAAHTNAPTTLTEAERARLIHHRPYVRRYHDEGRAAEGIIGWWRATGGPPVRGSKDETSEGGDDHGNGSGGCDPTADGRG